MFSFLQGTPAPELEPENTPDSSASMFGGLEMKDDNSQPSSSFGFIGTESTPGHSSFSFMQPEVETTSTGFSFMSSDAANGVEVTVEETPSSFSFMMSDNANNDVEVKEDRSSLLSLHFPSPSSRAVEDDAAEQIEELVDLKLNKTSLIKTVKKKKKSSKVGFGRDDEDDIEDKQQPPLQPPLQSHFGFLDEGVNAISSIDVDLTSEGDIGEPVSDSQFIHGQRTDLPSTPPPPLPSYPVPSLASSHPSLEDLKLAPPEFSPTSKDQEAPSNPTQSSHINSTVVQSGSSIDFRVMGDSVHLTPLSTLEPIASPETLPMPALSTPTSTAIPSMGLSPAESSVQKLERKSRDIQLQLKRVLSDLSRAHKSALAGQERFRNEIDREVHIIQQVKSRIETAEEEQTRLAAEEDFENAAALNDVIQNSVVEVHTREVTLSDLRASVRMLEETFVHERADCVDSFLRAANALRVTREQLEVALSQQHSSSERQWDLEDSRIRAELERIGLEKGHFEREELALAGDADRTEEAIRTQTGDLSLKKRELEISMNVLSEEIHLLQEQLRLKLSAQELLAADLNTVDGKIGEVRKKYDRQLQRISDRQSALQCSKNECLEEENVVLQEQRVLEAQAEESKKTKLTAAAWAASLEVDIGIADVLLSQLKVSNGGLSCNQMASISSLEVSAEDASSTQLKRDLETVTQLLHTKRNLNAELQAQRNQLVGESRRLADLFPALESEKKAHAASKRFKEAAAAAKELKEIQAAKEAIDSKVGEIDVVAASAVAEIARLEDEEAGASSALRDAHRQGDIVRFEHLLSRASQVRIMQQQVASKLRSIKDSNIPETSDGLGANVLSFLCDELESIQRDALVLKELHSLQQDISDSSEGEVCTNDVTPKLIGNTPEVDVSRTDDGDGSVEEIDQTAAEEGIVGRSGEGQPIEKITNEEEDEQPQRSPDQLTEDAVVSETEEHSAMVNQAALREARMLQAQDMIRRITSLSAQLDLASENEEYELAAELFEEVTLNTEQLNQTLDELHCSREEAELFTPLHDQNGHLL